VQGGSSGAPYIGGEGKGKGWVPAVAGAIECHGARWAAVTRGRRRGRGWAVPGECAAH
jgi:hypothetical protein